jgi:hypothetical protein
MSLINYEWYLDKLKNSPTEMFWFVPPDVVIADNFKFDIYFPPENEYDRKMNHAFLNGRHYDGIFLFSKHRPISKREFELRFPVERKEWSLVASNPKPFDIVFISYNEPNADENYKKLCERYPNAKRVHGVKGIHNAHIEAAKLSNTTMFWVIDGDAVLLDDFNLTYHVPYYSKNNVFVWRSRNPINNLEYGYGGVKLLPKELTLNMDVNSADMTTSISDNFNIMDDVSNITSFNTDPFNTWKSAFRECAKLASGIIARQDNRESIERLDVWCTVANGNFSEYALAGANAGKEFVNAHPDELNKINNFDWLHEQFSRHSI